MHMALLVHWLAAFLILLGSPFYGTEVSATVAPIVPPAQAMVIFGGDMMFDRTIRTTIDAKGGDFIFSCIDGTLRYGVSDRALRYALNLGRRASGEGAGMFQVFGVGNGSASGC